MVMAVVAEEVTAAVQHHVVVVVVSLAIAAPLLPTLSVVVWLVQNAVVAALEPLTPLTPGLAVGVVQEIG